MVPLVLLKLLMMYTGIMRRLWYLYVKTNGNHFRVCFFCQAPNQVVNLLNVIK